MKNYKIILLVFSMLFLTLSFKVIAQESEKLYYETPKEVPDYVLDHLYEKIGNNIQNGANEISFKIVKFSNDVFEAANLSVDPTKSEEVYFFDNKTKSIIDPSSLSAYFPKGVPKRKYEQNTMKHNPAFALGYFYRNPDIPEHTVSSDEFQYVWGYSLSGTCGLFLIYRSLTYDFYGHSFHSYKEYDLETDDYTYYMRAFPFNDPYYVPYIVLWNGAQYSSTSWQKPLYIPDYQDEGIYGDVNGASCLFYFSYIGRPQYSLNGESDQEVFVDDGTAIYLDASNPFQDDVFRLEIQDPSTGNYILDWLTTSENTAVLNGTFNVTSWASARGMTLNPGHYYFWLSMVDSKYASEYNMTTYSHMTSNGKLVHVLPCPLNQSIAQDITGLSFYQAQNYLYANNEIFSGAEAYYKAGQGIKLQNGFTVNANAKFHANLDQCGMDYFPRSYPFQDFDSEDEAEKSNESVFKLYPNPSSGNFNISLEGASVSWIVSIYNSLGALIRTQEFQSSSNSINISDQPKGIYIVKIQTGDQIYTEKVIYK